MPLLLEKALNGCGIVHKRNDDLAVLRHGSAFNYDNIIVELKAVSKLEDSHRSQVFNYLKATGYKVALLFNFGAAEGLEYERKVK